MRASNAPALSLTGRAGPPHAIGLRSVGLFLLAALGGVSGLALALDPVPAAARTFGAALLFVAATVAAASVQRVRTVLTEALEEKQRAISSLLASTEKTSASEARLRLLFDSAADGVVELVNNRSD